MQKLTRPRQALALNAYFFGNAFKWNILHPLVLPVLVLHFAPQGQKNTFLGLLTFFGLVLAAILQPLSGALSDQWRGRWGRRRPLMLVGALLDLLFLWMLGWLVPRASNTFSGLTLILLGYIGLQFSSNLSQGPAQGLLPDCMAAGKLGLASGIKNLLEMLGLVAAALIGGHYLAPDGSNSAGVLALVAGLFWLALLISLAAAREPAYHQARQTVIRLKALWRHTFRLDGALRGGYGWLIVQRLAFLFGLYGLQAFIQYYMQDVLQAVNPVKETGNLLAILTLSLAILGALGGWAADRWGAHAIIRTAGILAAAGYLLAMQAVSPQQLVLYGALLGAGAGLFMAANWTLANRLAPQENAGRYLGLTNLATAGAAALARLAGPLVDALNALLPGQFIGYRLLFILGTAGALLSLFALKKIPTRA